MNKTSNLSIIMQTLFRKNIEYKVNNQEEYIKVNKLIDIVLKIKYIVLIAIIAIEVIAIVYKLLT